MSDVRNIEVDKDVDYRFRVKGLEGVWEIADQTQVDGQDFWLLENDKKENAVIGKHGTIIIMPNVIRNSVLLQKPHEDTKNKVWLDEPFVVNALKVAAAPIERMPDESISVGDMNEYGYMWGGMLPLREEKAKELASRMDCDIYRLYEDDTEGLIDDEIEIDDHASYGGIFGIEKERWLGILREKTKEEDKKMSSNEKKYPALYTNSWTYAREHGEADQYRQSKAENECCQDTIEKLIRINFDGMNLDPYTAKKAIELHGAERVAYVLASTIQVKDWDGRFSRSNREWADTVPTQKDDRDNNGYDRRLNWTVNSHPAVLDGFVNQFRKEIDKQLDGKDAKPNKKIKREDAER